MEIFAVIPARSKSKRFKNKNISILGKKPLFMHSINFAKKLSFVNKIIFSTDSEKYMRLIKDKKKIIFHKRSRKASSDKAMEEDILKDLVNFFRSRKIDLPFGLLWLRPTHPLRSLEIFKKGYSLFKKYQKTVMIVHQEESRLFYVKANHLLPINNNLKNKSMIRSQDCKPLYSIFSGEFFKFSEKISKKFLGPKLMFVVSPKKTNVDIDNKEDLENLNKIIKYNRKYLKHYLHD